MATKYTLEFKEAVCQDYLKTGATKAFIRDKYHLSHGSLVRRWLIQMGHKDIHRKCNCNCCKNKSRIIIALQQQLQQQNIQGLEEKVKQLEQKLLLEKKLSEKYQKTLDEKLKPIVMVNITDIVDFNQYRKKGIIGIFKKWYSKIRNCQP